MAHIVEEILHQLVTIGSYWQLIIKNSIDIYIHLYNDIFKGMFTSYVNWCRISQPSMIHDCFFMFLFLPLWNSPVDSGSPLVHWQ